MSLTFDIPQTALFAYKTLWTQRHYTARLIAIPLLLKFVCAVAVLLSGAGNDFIRQSIIMLPSYFAEGWMIAQYLRTQLTGERWPYPVDLSSVANEVKIIRRVRGLLACIICYVLTMMGIALIASLTLNVAGTTGLSGETRLSPDKQAMITGIMIASIFLFRFMWLPLPLVVNTPIAHYISITKGFLPSVKLFALWLLVTLSAVITFIGSLSIIMSLLVSGPSIQSQPTLIFLTLIESFALIIIKILSMSAIAQALKPHLIIS